MNTTAFGSVEVHTTVHANDVGIQIGSERGDLRGLLANELPAIAHTLQQQNLRLNQVNVHQGLAFSNGMLSGNNSQQRSFVPRSAVAASSTEAGDGESINPADSPPAPLSSGRFSILA
jgi:flagellar hook-length control protein FliK